MNAQFEALHRATKYLDETVTEYENARKLVNQAAVVFLKSLPISSDETTEACRNAALLIHKATV
jgi:uncharacterized protein YdcH (DUF465 family)